MSKVHSQEPRFVVPSGAARDLGQARGVLARYYVEQGKSEEEADQLAREAQAWSGRWARILARTEDQALLPQ